MTTSLDLDPTAIEVSPGQAPPHEDGDKPLLLDTDAPMPDAGTSDVARPLDLQDLLRADLPPRKWLIEGFMQERDLAMVHAYRGVGKSRFAQGLAVATASGGRFLRFTAPAPRGVLLVDGELPREDMQKMLAQAVAGSPTEPTAPLRILSADLSEAPLRSLATEAGRRQVEHYLNDVSLLILDAISTLCPGAGPENDAESWEEMQSWLLEMRRCGISVLLLHHDGKGGNQRGTSKREDVLSQVVQLKHPADYEPNQGARFEVHFTKSRGLVGEAVAPIEARFGPDSNGIDKWTYELIEDAQAIMVKRLRDEGMTQRDIAKELGIGLATVNRALKRVPLRHQNGRSSVPSPSGETRNTALDGEPGAGR
jgi:putative DNA primase/helicase